ncbi:protein kinase [Sphingomonas sp. CGMCC 1.13654]|uniref:non-specific serine/threonine protein kinase n=1 Tax=Sphingomonas chungangi TaxID=2683589 RepID=A0A838L6M1_9SPHN|nr:serine/threonine-protein kinase [Sphingomonas chungangi]MBA2935133.1 protein kinase [Sphingomonas chungangi]MVW56079.1 protein kinase [Sphingomonas chungangi]
MRMFGRYRIEERIGEGAMAEVFRARDTGIDRIVAIKALKPEYHRHPELAQRFLREATAAGTLSHAHIATIHDVGEVDGAPYIAMELVSGRPLDETMQVQGRMPYERVLAIGIQLADALAYAHAQGVVHRDVKPSNIMLSADGRAAKLLDFGVARIGDIDHAGADLARTQAGQLIGTPRYMSPEQALGVPVDHRSDLFSLGAVLYEMVTGKVAFDGNGLATLALQITQQQPEPVERSARDCPKGLRFIIDKLLAKKPDQRFADGAQLRQALQRELDAVSVEESVRRRGLALRVKLPLVLIGATALALGSSVWIVLDRQQAALEHMAVVSGGSIAAFVTSNAALQVADNASLPPAQQDWAPLQAFVDTAAHDVGVRRLVVADAGGIVRAASDPGLIGRRYIPVSGEAPVASDMGVTAATDATGGRGFRFVRAIRYAGTDVGKVDLLLRRTALDGAVGLTRGLLIALSIFIMTVVATIGWLSGTFIARPLRRLRRALNDVAAGDTAFRLSHRRSDEFGAAFDAFNHAAAAIESRLAEVPGAASSSMAATLVAHRRAA